MTSRIPLRFNPARNGARNGEITEVAVLDKRSKLRSLWFEQGEKGNIFRPYVASCSDCPDREMCILPLRCRLRNIAIDINTQARKKCAEGKSSDCSRHRDYLRGYAALQTDEFIRTQCSDLNVLTDFTIQRSEDRETISGESIARGSMASTVEGPFIFLVTATRKDHSSTEAGDSDYSNDFRMLPSSKSHAENEITYLGGLSDEETTGMVHQWKAALEERSRGGDKLTLEEAVGYVIEKAVSVRRAFHEDYAYTTGQPRIVYADPGTFKSTVTLVEKNREAAREPQTP